MKRTIMADIADGTLPTGGEPVEKSGEESLEESSGEESNEEPSKREESKEQADLNLTDAIPTSPVSPSPLSSGHHSGGEAAASMTETSTSSIEPAKNPSPTLPATAQLATPVTDSTHHALADVPPDVRPDALAGALPEWDLVPHAQFVRRVKRKGDPPPTL